MSRTVAAWVFVFLHLLVGQGVAQEQPDTVPRRLHAGFVLLGAAPAGDFADHLDQAFGIGVDARYRVDAGGRFSVRADARWLIYGWDDTQTTLASPFGGTDEVNLTTTQNFFMLEVGPEVALDLGTVRPYAGLNIGAVQFLSQSSARASSGNVSFSTNVEHGDLALAWGGQAGVRFPLSGGARAVSLDFRVRYQRTGTADFVPEDAVRVTDQGFLEFTPVRDTGELWIFGAGLSIPVGARSLVRGGNL